MSDSFRSVPAGAGLRRRFYRRFLIAGEPCGSGGRSSCFSLLFVLLKKASFDLFPAKQGEGAVSAVPVEVEADFGRS